MPIVNVYLTFDGECEAAFEHYRSVFGGEFASMGRFRDMPPDPDYPVDEAHGNRVMHVTLPIGRDTLLMGSDTLPGAGPELVKGTNFSVSVATGSRDEADRVFAGLGEGGEVIMPLGDTFWNAYFGMCRDPFGIQWRGDYTEPPT